MLEAKDYRNAIALINRAQLTGGEAEEVAELKRKLTLHADRLETLDSNKPRPPTQAEVFDIERPG